MFIVQILLPLNRNDGTRQPAGLFEIVRDELTTRFGGLTAYTRSPAVGLWKDSGEHASRDDLVIFEVMADELDRAWWDSFRRLLESRFQQHSIVIRAVQSIAL